MRVAFFGTPAPAATCLAGLIDSAHPVVAVVCQPDRPAGRSGRPVPPAVKRLAVDHGLQVLQPRKIRTRSFAAALAETAPDVLAVVAYGRILPRSLLDLPPHGAVNVHFSLLPELRGAAPVQWALARGAERTGVTTMRINERLDEGDVLLQEAVAIEPGEHAPALTDRLAARGAGLLLRTLDGLRAGEIVPRPQDSSRATLAPLLKRSDGFITPDLTAREVEGRIRGFDPWPGAWLRRGDRRIRLVSGRVAEARITDARPGAVVAPGSHPLALVCAGGTVLSIDVLQAEGRRAMGARDAVNGRLLRAGDRLEPIAPEAAAGSDGT